MPIVAKASLPVAVLLLLACKAINEANATERTVELQTNGGMVESRSREMEALMADVNKHPDAAPLIRRQAPPGTKAMAAVEESFDKDDDKAVADENTQPTDQTQDEDAEVHDLAAFTKSASTKLGGGHIGWKVANDKCVTRDATTQKLTVSSCASYYDQLWYWDEHWRLHNEEDGQTKCVQAHTTGNHGDADHKQWLEMEDCHFSSSQKFVFGRRRDNHKLSLLSAIDTNTCWQHDASADELVVTGCEENNDQKFHFTDRRRTFHRRRRAGWDQQGDDSLDELKAGSSHKNIKHEAGKDEEHTGHTEHTDDQGKHRDDAEEHDLTAHSNGNTPNDSPSDVRTDELPEAGL